MKKKLLFGLLVLTLVALPLFGACAEPEPAPTPSPTPAPAPAETIELIFNHFNPEVASEAKVAKAWGDKIEELSDGRVKFVYYWGNTLITPGETVKSIQAGVADVSFFVPEQNFQPLSYVLFLPFMGSSIEAGTATYKELLNKFPEMIEEYEGFKLFSLQQGSVSNIHMTNKMVKAPADLKGMKIRTAMAKSIANMIEATGGTPVEVVPPDLYVSLERGLIDGVYFNLNAINAHGCMPLLPYHTMFGEAGFACDLNLLVVCLKTWNKFPADIQKIFEDLEPWYSEELKKATAVELENATAIANELGHTFTNLTPEEIKVWSDLAQPIHEAWIAETEAQGKPGRAIYEEAKRLIAEYSQ